MRKKKELSIVTVNYAHSEFIAQLADSLEEANIALDYEWILVDNGSRRNEGEILKQITKHHDNWHVVELDENLGFGGGNMEGIRFAEGEYVLILNPDTKVRKGSIEKLVEIFKAEKNAGVVAPRLKTFEGENIINARRFPSIWDIVKKRFFGRNPDIYNHTQKITPVEWIFGAALLVEREEFLKLGGFDKRFFLFLEDTDLCRVYWQNKKRVLLVNDVYIEHNVARLSGNDIFTALRRKTFWIHIASFLKYLMKYVGKKKPKLF